jgi:molecular chaperone DnaJ
MTNADWINKDYYKALGVAKDASAAEIKKAYRKLARLNHPDSNAGDKSAEERFKAIAEAYDVIGDDEKRKQYDQVRTMGVGGFGPFVNQGGYAQDFDLNDLFAQAGGGSGGAGSGIGDLFGGMFGGGRRRPPAARRGHDIETDTTLAFVDSIEGATVSLRLTADAPCSLCNGTGAKPGTSPRVCHDCGGAGLRAASAGGAFTMNETCTTCRGRGRIVDDPCSGCHGTGRGLSSRTISAKFPAGVKDGQKIRLRGKGEPGERGAPAGDLLINIKVAPHDIFGRSGDNLTVKVPVSFPEAALGGEVRVPTLNGSPVTVRIPAGTPNGRTFRVRGKGVHRMDGSRGDLMVTLDVHVPAHLTDGARAAVEALRDAMDGSDLRARLFTDVAE